MIGVSACLMGIACRYNKKGLYHPLIEEMTQKMEILPLCPEELAGFSTPRKPCEMIGGGGKEILLGTGKVINIDGEDITGQMIEGAQGALEECIKKGITRFFVQMYSPSCGCGWVYDGSFSGKKIPGDGVFTALLKQNNIQCIPLRGKEVKKGDETCLKRE